MWIVRGILDVGRELQSGGVTDGDKLDEGRLPKRSDLGMEHPG